MTDKKFRFHLLSLTHLPQSATYLSCAFTQKCRKLAKMITSLGHDVFFYGSEGSDVEEYCQSDKLHFVQTHTLKDIADSWGDGDNRFEIGYDFTQGEYRHDFNTERKPATLKYYKNVIEHINLIKKPDDFLLNQMGYYYQNVADAVKLFLHVESGAGYRGSYPGHYKCFESAFLRDFSYGGENPGADINGVNYDRVIPNYFDDSDIEFSEEKGDYYLYLGRMIKRKGILEAAMACEAIGAKLILAGQGASVRENGHLIPNTNPDFDLAPATWEYVGFVGVKERKPLLAHAIATFVMSEYQEPFGGVHIESRLSGTPVLTTDFAVFSASVENGLDGYRCNTLDDLCWAAQECRKLKPRLIRKRSEKYLMDNVRWEYAKWFDELHSLFESAYGDASKGWHEIRKEEPEWRRKIYYSRLTKK